MARFAFLVALAFVLTLSARAGANMAKWWHDGEEHGPLVPRNDADVGVDSEDLVFDVAPSLDHATVSATYRMTYAGGAPTTAEVAFVVVDDETPSHRGGAPEAKIAIDGAPVSYRVLDVVDVLEPLLEAWLDAHPAVAAELAKLSQGNPGYGEWTDLARLVPGCHGECSSLVAWYRTRHSSEAYEGKLHREEALAAAQTALPDDVAKTYAGWSKLPGDRPLHWLLFEIPFEAGASRTVTVAYEHIAGSDESRGVDDVFLYDYLLSPASRWAHFGELRVSVHTPPKTQLRSSLPLTRRDGPTGATYEVALPKLPPGELSLELMSLQHVPFGLTHSAAYWVFLLAGMLAVALALGRSLGRRFARARSKRPIAWSLLLTGPLVLLATCAVAALLAFVSPRHAFGYGYDPLLATLLAIGAFTLTGIAVSAVSAMDKPRPG